MSNSALPQRAPSQWLALAMGLALLAIALPYAGASGLLLFAPHGTEQLEDRYRMVLAVFPDGDVRMRLALLEMASARSGEGSWQEAESALKDAVSHRAQEPLNWARLAYVYGEQGKLDEVGPALSRSIESGAYIPGFMTWRLMLGLKYWDALNVAERQAVAGQALLLWQVKPNDFIRLARMAAFAGRIESVIGTYYPSELEAVLQRRRPLRHTR